MSYCERYLIGAFIGFAYAQLALFQEIRDPSPQEVALVDWASGIYVAVCGDTPIDNVTSLFKSAFVDVLNNFCQNITACHLQRRFGFGTTASSEIVINWFTAADLKRSGVSDICEVKNRPDELNFFFL